MNVSRFLEYNDETRFEMLANAMNVAFIEIKRLKAELAAFEGQVESGPPKGPAERPRPSKEPTTQRLIAMSRLPLFTQTSSMAAYEKHSAVLGGLPSDEGFKATFAKAGPLPYNFEQFKKSVKCTSKEASAWLYLLGKFGLLSYDVEERIYREPNWNSIVPDSEAS